MMANTAIAVESITDPALFERLVTNILRNESSELKQIIHSGINSMGKCINSKVDGFVKYSDDSGSHVVLLAHTITKRDGLREKWLSNSEKEPGDLSKALKYVKKLRNINPNIKIRIILTTNQRLDDRVSRDVMLFGETNNIDVRILEQSRIADYLDNEPMGHWLRKQYLGIEAELLSEPQLHLICKNNLKRYESQIAYNQKLEYERKVESDIQMHLDFGDNLILLSGKSGMGKSALAYRLLKKHVNSGGFGLWLSEEIVESCQSLEESIEKVIRNEKAGLYFDRETLNEILLDIHSRFICVIDDVNHVTNPSKVCGKIISWSRLLINSTGRTQFKPYQMVCPIQEKVLDLIEDSIGGVTNISVEPLSQEEGIKAIERVLTEVRIQHDAAMEAELLDKLGYDPFIMNLFSGRLIEDPSIDLSQITSNTIELFVTNKVKKAAFQSNNQFISNELMNALVSIADFTLLKKNPHMLLNEVKQYLKQKNVDPTAINYLIDVGGLCSISQDGHLFFYHDRIMKYCQTERLKKMILAEEEIPPDILNEPYFADIIGEVIVSADSSLVISRLREQNILALFEAFRIIKFPRTINEKQIVDEIVQWIDNELKSGLVLPHLTYAASRILMQVDSPLVLDLTERMKTNTFIHLARLRNGSALSGINYLTTWNVDITCRDTTFENAIVKAFTNNKEMFIQELKQALVGYVDKKRRKAAIVLVGYAGLNIFNEEIATCWLNTDNKSELIEAVLFAGLECGQISSSIFSDVLKEWAKLASNSEDTIDNISSNLCIAVRKPLTSDVCDGLYAGARKYPELKTKIYWVLLHNDSPKALEYAVRGLLTTYNDEIRSQDWIISNLYWPWGHGRKMSPASIEHLRSLWENEEENNSVRYVAFHIWADVIDATYLGELQSLSPTLSFYRRSLWKRGELRDRTIVPELLKIIQTEPHWFFIVPSVWNNDLYEATDEYLSKFGKKIPKDFTGKSNEEYDLAEALRTVPRLDAEQLLIKHWSNLGYSIPFVHTAIYVATKRTLELSDDSIEKCPDKKDIFRILDFDYSKLDFSIRFTKCHADYLIRYQKYMSQDSLEHFAYMCIRAGFPEWVDNNLKQWLNKESIKKNCPSDDDIIEEIEEQFQRVCEMPDKPLHSVPFIILHFYRERHDQIPRLLNILRQYLTSNPTLMRFKLVALFLEEIGKRSDISILDRVKIIGEEEEQRKIIQNTFFLIQLKSLE